MNKIYLLVLFLGFIACTKTPEGGQSIVVNLSDEQQTIHSFGASDAWRCQFVGKNWPIEKREQMAEWLFSQEYDESGNPKGIGLSMWRFYLGAGSIEQGDDSGIKNEWRRAESFLNSDGSYDWSKYEGQTWFLRKSLEYGVDYRKAFMISAPVHYTLNGKAYSEKNRKTLNLQEGMMEPFANYMVDVLDHYINELNIPLEYLSPINEPQWGWDNGSQEGTPASNSEVYELTKILSSKLDEREIDSKVIVTEAAQLEFISDFDIESKKFGKRAATYAQRADQGKVFFDKNSDMYIGDLPKVEYALAGHSYFSTWPIKKQVETRKRLRESVLKTNPDMQFWQSEYCILEKNDEVVAGRKRDLDMPTALFVARVIHNDVVLANASNWQWWTAITQCDYKDGLIYLDRDGSFEKAPLKYDGDMHDSKLMWALGNYSLFVRPDMKRVGLHYSSELSDIERCTDVLASAYKSDTSVVLVAINFTDESKPFNLEIEGSKGFGRYKEIKAYETSATRNLESIEVSRRHLNLSPRSVTTFVMK